VKKFIILAIGDNEFTEEPVLIELQKNITEEQLQKKVNKIKENFENEGFYDWSYDDIVEELENQKIIKVYPNYTIFDIYA